MRTFRLCSILLALLLASFAASAAEYPINLEYREVGENIHVIVHNMGPAPVSVRASLSHTVNVASDRNWPIYQVVQAYSSEDLAKLSAADKSQNIEFNTSMDSVPGLFDAVYDPKVLYRLPYRDGSRYPVVQAPNGPRTTHKAAVNWFAVDFDMPQGTPVVAARDGMVIQAEDRYAESGKNPALADKANYVRILHADGTTAIYAHLMLHGVAVAVGQPVKAGMLIGYSGSTGFSGGPHLHFAVTHLVKTANGFDDVSIPVAFYIGNPAHIVELNKGASLTADYRMLNVGADQLVNIAANQPLAAADSGRAQASEKLGQQP